MTKERRIGRFNIVAGISRNSFGIGFNISKYGVDLTLFMFWITIEH